MDNESFDNMRIKDFIDKSTFPEFSSLKMQPRFKDILIKKLNIVGIDTVYDIKNLKDIELESSGLLGYLPQEFKKNIKILRNKANEGHESVSKIEKSIKSPLIITLQDKKSKEKVTQGGGKRRKKYSKKKKKSKKKKGKSKRRSSKTRRRR
jgi:uncharacterized protein (UPF0305 family)